MEKTQTYIFRGKELQSTRERVIHLNYALALNQSKDRYTLKPTKEKK